MIYISVKDFFEKVSSFSVMTRQEEIECAKQMKAGDEHARERLIQSYLTMVAAHIKRMSSENQTLGLIVYCQHALEHAVDTFDFLQDSETFSHRLSWCLRQASTKYIAERRKDMAIV